MAKEGFMVHLALSRGIDIDMTDMLVGTFGSTELGQKKSDNVDKNHSRVKSEATKAMSANSSKTKEQQAKKEKKKGPALTECGVYNLFIQNEDLKSAVTLQVIFLAYSDFCCYLRLSDGKHISPIVTVMKKSNINSVQFDVGAVISVKEVSFCKWDNTIKEEDCHPMEDRGICCFLRITQYDVVENKFPKSKQLGNRPAKTSYRDALIHVQDALIKQDPQFITYLPKDPEKYKKLTEAAEEMRKLGNDWFNKKEYNEAIVLYDVAKKKDPYDSRIWTNCSLAYCSIEEYEAAESDAVVAMKMDPFNYKAYLRAHNAAKMRNCLDAAFAYIDIGVYLIGEHKDFQAVLKEKPTFQDQIPVQINTNFLKKLGVLPSITKNMKNISGKSGHSKTTKVFTTTTSVSASSVIIAGNGQHDGNCSQNGVKITELDGNSGADTSRPKEESKKEKKKAKRKQAAAEENLKKQEEKAKEMVHKDKTNQDAKNEEEKDSKKEKEEVTPTSLAAIDEMMLEGRRKYDAGQFNEAGDIFKSLISALQDNDRSSQVVCPYNEREIELIHFMVGVCKVQAGKSTLFEGMDVLRPLCTEASKFRGKPAAHYFLARAYEKINLLKLAHQQAWLAIESLKKFSRFAPLVWPRADEDIECTESDVVEEESQELLARASSARPNPNGKCRFKECITMQGHDYAKEEIYTSDPDFKGYINVTCEEYCTVCYHPCCWKAYKEQLGTTQGKKTDKDFLGLKCVTPDCVGKIDNIKIYGDTGELKNEIIKDKKEKRNLPMATKQKKKKDKKKEKASVNKVPERKKFRSESVCDDQVIADEVSSVVEGINGHENTTKPRANVPHLELPIDRLDTSIVTILKPTPDEEEPDNARPKKNKKKNKKAKAAPQLDLIGDPLQADLSVQNEYVARLRALKQQRDATEGDDRAQDSINAPMFPGTSGLQWPMDPENPFYLPQNLRDNPEMLEMALRSNNFSPSVTEAQQETVNTLLDFMYDWLKSEGPMTISDARLKDQVADTFPEEAQSIVKQCGGIKEFLMQSNRFAMIDTMICTSDVVMDAQALVCNQVTGRMTNSSFLSQFSDGQKAKKFTHLLEDTRSVCSSSSSTSQLNESGESHASRVTTDSALATSKPLSEEENNKEMPTIPSTSSPQKPDVPECNGGNLNPHAPVFNFLQDSELVPWSTGDMEDDIEKWTSSTTALSHINVEVNGVEDDPITPPEHQVAEDDTYNSGEESQSEGEEDEEADGDAGDDKYIEDLIKTIEELNEKNTTLQDQNQSLNDKLFQVRSQAKSEVSNYKQQLEDLKERNKALEHEKQSLSSQREADLKKYKSETSRMQEEVKTFQNRSQSMEHKFERSNDRVNELQAKLVEEEDLNKQLKEEMRNLQESLTSSSRRAHEAEVKYMCIKKDLIEAQLNRVNDRLIEEANRMRQLLPSASDETVPDSHTLSRTIVAWDETIRSLRDRKNSFMNEGLRLLEMVNQGRPLNALPQGDLQIPDIPNISIAPLLCLGQKSSSQLASTIKHKTDVRNSVSPAKPVTLPALNIPLNIPPPTMPQAPGVTPQQPFKIAFGDLAMQIQSGPPPGAVVNGGAIPKGAGRGRSITPDVLGSQWSEGHPALPSQQTWEYKDGDLKPINVSNHAPNMAPKDIKMTAKTPKVEGEAGASSKSSAYGLSDISQFATDDVVKPSGNTVSTPPLHPTTTLTVPKPKFQNLPSSYLGSVGKVPPKLIRPQPKHAPTTGKSGNGKDDPLSGPYKRLVEMCREKIGKEFPLPDIYAALRELRAQNNNSLSGMSTDKIVERVRQQLIRNQRPSAGQAPVAPWADMTQGTVPNTESEWSGPSREDGAKDMCPICLDPLLGNDVVSLQCQHVFHKVCIKDWLSTQKTCPMCRKFELTPDEYPSLPHT